MPSNLPPYEQFKRASRMRRENQPSGRGPQYTVHPYGDEWLWNDEGDQPLIATRLEAAADLARRHRREMAASDTHRQMSAEAWFEIRVYVENDPPACVAVGYVNTADEFCLGEPEVDRFGSLVV